MELEQPATDDELIRAMFGHDRAVATLAKRIYDRRHADDPKPAEPAHCAECFEGCPKCQGPTARLLPVAIQRLLDEVRNDQPTAVGCFDRAHNRHNR
jgi:hypothetical protein